MLEIWRKVDENPQYEVSNKNGFRNTGRKKQPQGRIVNGYRVVGLGRKLGERQFHILVAKAFPEICGEWFKGCNVHHINFNRLDNTPENLVILSSEEHQKLHYKNAPDTFKKPSIKRNKSISKALKGKPIPERRIPILQFTIDGVFIREWEGSSIIEKETGIRAGNIVSVCRNKPYYHSAGGYKWKYKRDIA